MNEQEAQEAIKQVLTGEPWLSIEGLHSFQYYEGEAEKGRDCFGTETTYREFLDKLKERRGKFPEYWKEFAATCGLLGKMKKTGAVNKRYSSYGLKHVFEKNAEYAPDYYLPNGVLIAAAIYSGFLYKALDMNPNPYFNISNASINQLEKQTTKKD